MGLNKVGSDRVSGPRHCVLEATFRLLTVRLESSKADTKPGPLNGVALSNVIFLFDLKSGKATR